MVWWFDKSHAQSSIISVYNQSSIHCTNVCCLQWRRAACLQILAEKTKALSLATRAHYLLLCSLKLVYHEPQAKFDIHSKTTHGDVQEIAGLSTISLQALKEAGYHARRHPSSGEVIFKLKTHNLRPLVSNSTGTNTLGESFKGRRKDRILKLCSF